MIVISKLCKSYNVADGQKIDVLDEVDLCIEKGKTGAITGISGSGKTTFLSLIAGLDDVSSGSIAIDDNKIEGMNEKEITMFRAQNIGFIFQNFYLLPHLTALENVCLPLDILGRKHASKLAKDMISMVGLTNRQHQLPTKLSGGESQRIAIARAIVLQPAVILADEPTGNLDIDTGNVITDLLFGLVKEHGLTMLLVTHNQDLANRCDVQLKLVQGKLV